MLYYRFFLIFYSFALWKSFGKIHCFNVIKAHLLISVTGSRDTVFLRCYRLYSYDRNRYSVNYIASPFFSSSSLFIYLFFFQTFDRKIWIQTNSIRIKKLKFRNLNSNFIPFLLRFQFHHFYWIYFLFNRPKLSAI